MLDRVSTCGLAFRGHADRDGRVAVIMLTDEGRALVDRFESNVEARLQELVADWPDTQADQAAGTLTRLIGVIFADMDAEDQATAPVHARYRPDGISRAR